MDYKEYIKKNKIDISKRDIVFELSNLVTEARLSAGISQAELAKRIGTKQPSIARAESGELEPSISFLEKIAKAVGKTLVLPKFDFTEQTGTETIIIAPFQMSKKYQYEEISDSDNHLIKFT